MMILNNYLTGVEQQKEQRTAFIKTFVMFAWRIFTGTARRARATELKLAPAVAAVSKLRLNV